MYILYNSLLPLVTDILNATGKGRKTVNLSVCKPQHNCEYGIGPDEMCSRWGFLKIWIAIY